MKLGEKGRSRGSLPKAASPALRLTTHRHSLLSCPHRSILSLRPASQTPDKQFVSALTGDVSKPAKGRKLVKARKGREGANL